MIGRGRGGYPRQVLLSHRLAHLARSQGREVQRGGCLPHVQRRARLCRQPARPVCRKGRGRGKAHGGRSSSRAMRWSSRAVPAPASGAEHHMSHFLEMDFLRPREAYPAPRHQGGAGGRAVSALSLSHARAARADFKGKGRRSSVRQRGLPSCEFVLDTLGKAGLSHALFRAGRPPKRRCAPCSSRAYKIRDRFTILALYNEEGLMKDAVEELMEKFY